MVFVEEIHFWQKISEEYFKVKQVLLAMRVILHECDRAARSDALACHQKIYLPYRKLAVRQKLLEEKYLVQAIIFLACMKHGWCRTFLLTLIRILILIDLSVR